MCIGSDESNDASIRDLPKKGVITMLYLKKQVTIRDFRDIMYHQTDCLPVGQRLPVYSKNNTKSIGIIETLKDGFDIGTITVMEVNRADRRLARRKVKFAFESIDGGHRKRSIWEYLNNQFMVGGKFFSELSKEKQDAFLNTPLSFTIYDELDSATKGRIFRTLNKTTDVNFIEMLNSYGDTPIANFVREMVRVVKQIDNECHTLFCFTKNTKNEPVYDYLSFDNDRLKQDHAFARIVYRYTNALKNKESLLGGSSDTELRIMYEDATLTIEDIEKVKSKIKKHLEFLRKMGAYRRQSLKNGLTQHDFKALSYLWFYMIDTYGSFDIEDHEVFFEKYAEANFCISNKHGDYATVIHEESGYSVQTMYKKYIAAPWDGKKIETAISYLIGEMGDIEDLIETRDSRRDFTRPEKEVKLAEQKFRCAIDGKKLKWNDAHAAHIIAHSNGGRTVYSNLSMVRAIYNTEMGTMDLNQYREKIAA